MLEKLCELSCTYETDNDIEILLEYLQSAIPSVRESCILVSDHLSKTIAVIQGILLISH